MTTNEIIKEIAVYDGHTFTADILGTTVKKEGEINRVALDGTNLTKYPYFHSYLTDLNILHRVSVKVFCDVLSCKHGTISEVNAICENIKHEFINVPNEQGEHIELATATAEAIVYLKKYKP